MRFRIEIELLSDFAPGSGEGDAGGVDRDVIFDSQGLPYIPARRLRGCLREAGYEVVEAYRLAGIDLPGISFEGLEGLFGKPGTQQGCLKLDSAIWEGSDTGELQEWLRWSYEQNSAFNPLALKEAFTTLRGQTTISRVNGGPLTDSLRVSRVISRGHRFIARAEIEPPQGAGLDKNILDGYASLFELSCRALRRMGLSRNRGLGEVQLKTTRQNEETEVKAPGEKQTARAAPVNSAAPGTGAEAEPAASWSAGEAGGLSGSTGQVYELSYSFTLDNEAVFSASSGDPNLVESEDYVTGSAIRGGLAAAVMAQRGLGVSDAHRDPFFYRWFIQAGLSCLNAYPVDPENPSQRLLPVPLSVQSLKTDPASLLDLAASYTGLSQDDWRPATSTKQVEGFAYPQGPVWYLAEARTRYNYHTSRPNRLKGRADEGEGGVFIYEALEAGQVFAGKILGQKADLEKLCQVLGWNSQNQLFLRLGKSRSTQYGGAVRLLLTNEVGPTPFEREADDFSDYAMAPGPLPGYLVVTLLSPLIYRSPVGYFLPDFPVSELAGRLGISLEYLKSFTKQVLTGAYSTVWQLPRPQQPALAAGSVFVFRTPPGAALDHEKLRQVEAVSLGERTGEGFGRFILSAVRQPGPLYRQNLAAKQSYRPESAAPASYARLVKSMAWQHLEGILEGKALFYAASLQPLERISPASLARVQALLLRMPDLKAGLDELGKIKPLARQQFERLRSPGNGYESLYDHLQAHLSDRLPLDMQNTGLEEVARAIGWNMSEDSELKFRVVKCYLLALVNQLLRQRKQLAGQF